MRRHHTQMSKDEHTLLLSIIRARRFSFLPHAMDRMKQKRVTEAQISAMLTYCSVIEIHNNAPGDLRVLVRGKVRGDYVCAVVSLVTNQIVTTYWNAAGDHHKTLDTSEYTWTASVRDALSMFGCN